MYPRIVDHWRFDDRVIEAAEVGRAVTQLKGERVVRIDVDHPSVVAIGTWSPNATDVLDSTGARRNIRPELKR